MGNAMGAEGVVQMADKMTGALFARMTADEKIGLMRTMMTVCLTDILKNLSAEEKQRMAERAISNFATGLKAQANSA